VDPEEMVKRYLTLKDGTVAERAICVSASFSQKPPRIPANSTNKPKKSLGSHGVIL